MARTNPTLPLKYPPSALLCLVISISDGDTLKARCGKPGVYQQVAVRLSAIDDLEPLARHSLEPGHHLGLRHGLRPRCCMSPARFGQLIAQCPPPDDIQCRHVYHS